MPAPESLPRDLWLAGTAHNAGLDPYGHRPDDHPRPQPLTRRPGPPPGQHGRTVRMVSVGIHAYHDRIWHAPRPGVRVRLERVWSGRIRYGRAT